MIIRPQMHFSKPLSGKMLKSVVLEFLRDAPRLEALKNAYDNKRDILNRVREKGLPNNRLAHGFARYIVTLSSGYLLGKPVSYAALNEDNAALEGVLKCYRRMDADSVDLELAKMAAIFGRGVELVFADYLAQPCAVSLSPQSAFVVYDDTAAHSPMMGVTLNPKLLEDGTQEGHIVRVYTAWEEITYHIHAIEELERAHPTGNVPHYFGAVPMVEYWNGEDEGGDFEQVQTLIDAYDRLESDRINDKQQFVDALLVLTGVAMEKDEKGRTPARQLREDKLLCLPDSECKAEYLARSMAESDVEVLKNALKADIHKFSLVPDLSDEQFAGNASGVAMKYKLLGLEQLMRMKERWFKEALRQRLRLFAAFLSVKGAPALDVEAVSLTFTRSLPENELEIAQTVRAYDGLVPRELLLSQVPFVSDARGALESLVEKKEY